MQDRASLLFRFHLRWNSVAYKNSSFICAIPRAQLMGRRRKGRHPQQLLSRQCNRAVVEVQLLPSAPLLPLLTAHECTSTRSSLKLVLIENLKQRLALSI